jgi:hypothetical protein
MEAEVTDECAKIIRETSLRSAHPETLLIGLLHLKRAVEIPQLRRAHAMSSEAVSSLVDDERLMMPDAKLAAARQFDWLLPESRGPLGLTLEQLLWSRISAAEAIDRGVRWVEVHSRSDSFAPR